MSEEIRLEQVCNESLRDISRRIRGNDKFYEYLSDLVKVYLFSRYPERKVAALRTMKRFGGKEYTIHKIEHDGIIYAYISAENSSKYIFVGKYTVDDHFLEVAPNEEEIALWSKD